MAEDPRSDKYVYEFECRKCGQEHAIELFVPFYSLVFKIRVNEKKKKEDEKPKQEHGPPVETMPPTL